MPAACPSLPLARLPTEDQSLGSPSCPECGVWGAEVGQAPQHRALRGDLAGASGSLHGRVGLKQGPGQTWGGRKHRKWLLWVRTEALRREKQSAGPGALRTPHRAKSTGGGGAGPQLSACAEVL